MVIQTVLGPIEPSQLGPTLMHEHVFIDLRKMFARPEEASLQRYVDAPVDMSMLSLLRRRPVGVALDNLVLSDEQLAVEELSLYSLEGGSGLVDCTVIGLGRDPLAVRRVARASGLHIVQGTGVYVEPSHPDWVASAELDQLCELFCRDLTIGVGDTGVRAGIIGEIGTSGVEKGTREKRGDFTAEEEKVLRAAGRASVATGAAVTVHLDPRGEGAYAVIDVLSAEGVAPERMVMCHLDANPKLEYHLEVARRGVWVEYDHFGREYYAGHMQRPYTSDSRRLELLAAMLEAGCERQIVISQDVCMKMDLCHYGGVGYAHLLAALAPDIRRAGVGEEQLHQIWVDNPRTILAF